MLQEIILDNFSAPLSDLIDKERFDIYPVDGKSNTWVIQKKKIKDN